MVLLLDIAVLKVIRKENSENIFFVVVFTIYYITLKKKVIFLHIRVKIKNEFANPMKL